MTARVATKLIGAGLLAVIAFTVGWYVRSDDSGGVTIKRVGDSGGGLTPEASRLCAVTMYGKWVDEDVVFDDEATWTGSGVVISDAGGKLLVMTNSHCLDLPTIADQLETPDIKSYDLFMKIGNGAPIRVTRFAETPAEGLDLALLEIPIGALRRGVDFEVAPIHDRSAARQGSKVCAIGSPHGLSGTETYGHVSAVRNKFGGSLWTVIQTDAAINSGNSGGPLFLNEGDERMLVGINTFNLRGAEGLGFAFCADEYDKQEWSWFNADPDGAVGALSQIYYKKANLVK